jgi:hypothetical protein
MPGDRDDKLTGAGIPEDETSAEMEVLKDLFGQEQPAVSTESVFALDLFGEPAKPAPAPAPVPARPAAPASAVPVPPIAPQSYQPRAEEDIKIVTDDDLRRLFEASSPGRKPEPGPPSPPSPVPLSAEPIAAEELTAASLAAEEKPAAAEPAPAVEFKREPTLEGDLEEPVAPPEVDHGMKSAIIVAHEEVEEIGLGTEEHLPSGPAYAEPRPAAENPLEDISPDEIVANLEDRVEAGEMTAVAAGKKGEPLEKTASLIQQLEPPGKDLISVAELRRLFNNMTVFIEWAKTMSERMDRLEAALLKLTRGEGGDK